MYLKDVNPSSKSKNKFQKQSSLLTTLSPINSSKKFYRNFKTCFTCHYETCLHLAKACSEIVKKVPKINQ